MKAPSEAKLKKVIKAASENHGNVHAMAKAVGLSAPTIYNYMRKYPDVRKAVEEGQDDFYELVVCRMQQLIDQGNTAMISLFLKCSPAAHRKGWGERTVVQADGNMTDEQKAAYVKNLIGLQDDGDGGVSSDSGREA